MTALSFAQRKALAYAARPLGDPRRSADSLPRRDVRERLNDLGLTRLDDARGWTTTEDGAALLAALATPADATGGPA